MEKGLIDIVILDNEIWLRYESYKIVYDINNKKV